MRRLSLWLLFAAGGIVTGGCASEGTYRLDWGFTSGGSEESASIGCGAHGVDSIKIEARGPEGAQDAIVPCTDGATVRKILAATWGFNIHALGPDGGFKEPLPMEGTNILHVFLPPLPIAADKETYLSRILFEPQPACRDGVDNDRDGRIDTDDPQCDGPEGPSESGSQLAP
jgi:hypothetical protein